LIGVSLVPDFDIPMGKIDPEELKANGSQFI
jgi:hypothetical protein